MVPKAGDAHPIKLLENYIDEPLVLTRDAEAHIHCLSNVCTHRGNLMVYEPCSAQKHLRCKYHGRAFHLDGKFISMPEFTAVENFIPENNHLHHLPLYQWGPLLFTQLKKGNYYVYGKGFDTSVMQNVKGGIPYIIENETTQTIYLPITE